MEACLWSFYGGWIFELQCGPSMVIFTMEMQRKVSYPNFVRGPLLDDMRPFFGPCEVLGIHH